MTPAYDGSRTPSHHQPSASWDPTVANTPAHSTAHFDDEFDNGFGMGGAATPTASFHGGSRFGGSTPMSKSYKFSAYSNERRKIVNLKSQKSNPKYLPKTCHICIGWGSELF
jgi:hypothetical protein